MVLSNLLRLILLKRGVGADYIISEASSDLSNSVVL